MCDYVTYNSSIYMKMQSLKRACKAHKILPKAAINTRILSKETKTFQELYISVCGCVYVWVL